MGTRSKKKYVVIVRLAWMLIRPFAVAAADDKEDDTMDSNFVQAMDIIMSSDLESLMADE